MFVLPLFLAAAIWFVWSPAAHADNTIQACYQKENGQLRILKTGRCRPSELPLSWNMQGPKGDKGDKGDMGDPGVSGLMRKDSSSPNSSDSHQEAFALCPPGKHVVGGGAQVFFHETKTIMGPVAVKTSYPSQAMNGWAASAEEIVPTDLVWHVTAFALCADVTMPPP
jgi:hypothetical protein